MLLAREEVKVTSAGLKVLVNENYGEEDKELELMAWLDTWHDHYGGFGKPEWR